MVAAIIAAQSLGKTEQKMYNLIRKKKEEEIISI